MKNMSMGAKFAMVVLVFVITIFGVFGIGMMNLVSIKDSSSRIVKVVAARRYQATKVFGSVESASANQKDLILSKDTAKSKIIEGVYRQDVANAKVALDKLKELADDSIKKDVDEAAVHFEKWLDVSTKVNQLAVNNQDDEAYTLMSTKSELEIYSLEDNLLALTKIVNDEMERELQQNEESYQNSRNLGIFLSLLGLAMGTTLAVLVIRSITRSINVTVEILNDTALQVAASASQVASSSQSLAETATEQASSLEETSSAVEEMNSMIARNAQAAQDSTVIALKGVASATRGQEVVQSMMLSMDEINQANKEVVRQTDESNQRIAEIVQVINEIGNKTKIINEIVFQTKLLSFNASVEAARAGEHGKGFAVVAEEVGNLAQMSGNAAKDITSLLDGSMQRVQSIVSDSKSKIEKLISENNKKVESGTRIAGECRDVLNDIVQGISSVSQMVQSISGASDEQSRGIDEINRAIIQLDQVTQSNAATSEEAASASEELSAQAAHMKEAVNGLVRIVRGQDAVFESAPKTRPISSKDGPLARKSTNPGSKATAQVAAVPALKKAKNSRDSNVIHMGRTSKVSYGSETPSPRVAMGGDIVPSEDDPRFKDI